MNRAAKDNWTPVMDVLNPTRSTPVSDAQLQRLRELPLEALWGSLQRKQYVRSFEGKVQTDWTSGEWHEAIQPDGSPRGGNKAHPWKAGYHNGRAIIESVERIRAIQRRQRP